MHSFVIEDSNVKVDFLVVMPKLELLGRIPRGMDMDASSLVTNVATVMD